MFIIYKSPLQKNTSKFQINWLFGISAWWHAFLFTDNRLPASDSKPDTVVILPALQYYDDSPECGGHSQSAHVWTAPSPHTINPISWRNSRSPLHSRDPMILPEAKDHPDTHNEGFGVIPQSFQLTNIWQNFHLSSSSLRCTIRV